MSFEGQSLSDFIAAKAAASNMLRAEGVRDLQGGIGFEEALIMQAASDVLRVRQAFYGYEIMEAVDGASGRVYPVLGKFENLYGITVSHIEGQRKSQKTFPPPRPRREYKPTAFGRTLFGLFVPRTVVPGP